MHKRLLSLCLAGSLAFVSLSPAWGGPQGRLEPVSFQVDPAVPLGAPLNIFLSQTPDAGLRSLLRQTEAGPEGLPAAALTSLLVHPAQIEAASQPLSRLIGTENLPVLRSAAETLAREASANPALASLVSHLRLQNEPPTAASLEALASALDRLYSGPSLPPSTSAEVQSEARRARLRTARAGLGILLPALHSRDESVTQGLAAAVPELAAGLQPAQKGLAVELMRTLLKDPREATREAAAKSLGGLAKALGPEGAETAWELYRAGIADPYYGVRRETANSLGAFAQVFGAGQVDEIIKQYDLAARHDDYSVRLGASYAFPEIAKLLATARSEALSGLYADALASGSRELESGAAKTAGSVIEALGPRRPGRILELYRDGLAHRAYDVPRETAKSLGALALTLGPEHAGEIVALAEDAARSELDYRRAGAAASLPDLAQALGPDHAEWIFELYRKLLKDPEGRVAGAAARSIGGLARSLGPAHADRILAAAQRTVSAHHQDVSKGAAESLPELAAALGPAHAEAILALCRAGLSSYLSEVRGKIAEDLPVLTEVLGPGQADELLALLHRTVNPHDPETQAKAIAGLARMARVWGPPRAAAVLAVLKEGFSNPRPSVRWTAAQALGEVAEALGPNRADELLALYSSGISDDNEDVREEAAKSLSGLARALGPARPEQIAELYRKALSEGDSRVNRGTAAALPGLLAVLDRSDFAQLELATRDLRGPGTPPHFWSVAPMLLAEPTDAWTRFQRGLDLAALIGDLRRTLEETERRWGRRAPTVLARAADLIAAGFLPNEKDLSRVEDNRLLRDLTALYERELKTLELESIEFKDGGDARTNYHSMMEDFFTVLAPRMHDRPEGLPVRERVSREKLPVYEGFKPVAGDARFAGSYGRTLVFKGGGKAVHIKLLKKGEDPSLLAYEHDVMNYLGSKKAEWGLRGLYPRGVVRLGVIKLDEWPADLDRETRFMTNSVDLGARDGVLTFMAYEMDLDGERNPFTTYLNDPSLSPAQFQKALEINVHDRFAMARHGLFDLEIIELFHNQEHDHGRRYDWMVDISHHQRHRRGAGRLNDFVGATVYPNVRLSGPADFASLVFIDDLIDSAEGREMADNRISRLLNKEDKDWEDAHNLISAALLGDTLLSLALIPPTYFERRGELAYEQESGATGTPLQKSLAALFDSALRAYNDAPGMSFPQGFLRIPLIAAQMAYFMTDAYVEAVKERQLPQDLFPGSQVRYGRANGSRGWTERGWDIREKTHSLPGPETPRKKSRDLGPVNGANPLQALIRALYIAATYLTKGP